MSSKPTVPIRPWFVALAVAAGLLVWTNLTRVQRIEHVSTLTGEAVAFDEKSPTGYAGGVRTLLIPEHNTGSMQWIVQVQEMAADGQLRLRHVDYDNAPEGRPVHDASAYRWWYGFVAWCHALVSDAPPGASVERVALWVDPILHLLVLAGGVLLVARFFGSLAGVLFAVAGVFLFPFASAFLPGQPDEHGLALACAAGAILPLLATHVSPRLMSDRSRRGATVLGGIAGALLLWIDIRTGFAVLGGVSLGAVAVAVLQRRADCGGFPILPWRAWGLSGGIAALILGLIDYLPNVLVIEEGRLRVLLPVAAVAWIALGEVLARLTDALRGRATWTKRTTILTAVATGVVLALPAMLLFAPQWFAVTADPAAERLTRLPDGAAARNFISWFGETGFSLPLVATVLPLGLLVPAAWVATRSDTPRNTQAALLLAVGPVIVGLGVAAMTLRAWQLVDVALLGVVVAGAASGAPTRPAPRVVAIWSTAVAILVFPGLLLLRPLFNVKDIPLREIEVKAMIERDLAYWLALRADETSAIVLAPPSLSAAAIYYGGQRALGTPFPENDAGFTASVRLAGATTPDEAQALAQRREVTHIIIPSWDPFLEEYARLATNKPEDSLVALLRRWQAPRWLRPVPYHLPQIEGMENAYAAIFEIVDVQDNATALSRLAEYFLEMGQAQPAMAIASSLKSSFASDLSGLVARANVAGAAREVHELNSIIEAIQPYLERGDEDLLPIDRRVSLALALAQARRMDLARTQLERCLEMLDAAAIRSLSTGVLFRMQALGKALNLEISDPELRTLARALVPPEMRARL